jgi:hypothetical protein
MNKVILTKKPREVFQQDPEWKEYAIAREDINLSLLRIIYDREDVQFVLDHLKEEFQYDLRRKNVYFYSNKDIDGLKEFMVHMDYDVSEPEILE